MSAPNYLEDAQKAIDSVIARLDHETADIEKWSRTEQYDDIRAGYAERLAMLREQRKALEAMRRLSIGQEA